MVRRRSRLSRSREYDRVFRHGRSVANRYLVLYYFERPEVENEPAARCRVGFSVSKRLGNAVERNRVKRILREAYRLNEHRMTAGMDFVLIARMPLLELLRESGFAAVEKKLIEVFGKASLLVPPGDGKSGK